MDCPNCGKKNSDDAPLCSSCGWVLCWKKGIGMSVDGRIKRSLILKKITLTGIPALVLLAGGLSIWRAFQVSIYPVGGGQYVHSPNGKYTASANNMYYEDFWGHERSYYEFSILPKWGLRESEAIKTVRMDPIEGQPEFPMRGDERIIKWSPDSTSVTFAFQGVELTLNLYQTNSN